jgi:hypothetical protein
MRTQVVTLVCAALFAAGCGGGGSGDGQSGVANDQAVPATASTANPDPNLVSTAVQDLGAAGAAQGADLQKFSDTGVTRLLKQGDTLLLSGAAGLVAVTSAGPQVLVDEPIAASIFFGGRLWVATEGALATADGLVKIVPQFATPFTSLAVYDEDLYAGTAGNGVWKLASGELVPVSEDWQVKDLAATEFGLFAATDKGLFSYAGDRWHARRLDDTSTALSNPTVLYARYPYLYVGSGSNLLRYDGGKWETFGLDAQVSALGWHDAKLFIGTATGTLSELAEEAVTSVASPEAGAITSILRFDGRLHVVTAGGVFRLRHGRFEKIDWDEPAQSEPKHEPIAFLL